MAKGIGSFYQELQRSRRMDLLSAFRQGGFSHVFKMFNRYFIKSLFGPFYLFVMPLALYGIIGELLGHEYLFPGMCALCAMLAAGASMPFSILELRRSVLIKRIGSSPVRPSLFSLVIFVYFLCANLLSTCWLMLWSLVFFQDTKMFANLGTVSGFFSFVYGAVLNSIIAIALGFTIACLSKNPLFAQSIGLAIVFPSSFLSGQIIWQGTLAGSSGFTIAAQIVPFRYTSMYMFEGWTGPPQVPVFNEATSLFALNADGSPVLQQFGNANAFAVHDFYLASRDLPNPLAYNANYRILSQLEGSAALDYRNSVVGNYTPVVLAYSQLDHILGYVIPYVYAIFLVCLPAVKFSWVER